MAMGAERSKQLHNFRMPCDLRWGNQRFLRCMKVDSDGDVSPVRRFAGFADRCRDQRRRTIRDRELFSEIVSGVGSSTAVDELGEEEGIAAMREKVISDLQTAADKMKHALLSDSVSVPPPPSPAAEPRWNLRNRGGGGGTGPGAHRSPTIAAASPPRVQMNSPSAADCTIAAAASTKLAVSLSKREIEEDFFSMAGRRPPRRPKKRTRIVQKSLDDLFPALWLTEITPEKYKVAVPAP